MKAILPLVLLMSACGPQSGGRSHLPPGAGGGEDLASEGAADLVYVPSPHGQDGSVDPGAEDMDCGGMSFALERVPPNVMLVLDRSGSMAEPIDFFSLTTKWDDLKKAVTGLVNGYDGQIRLGADLYSDPSQADCLAGSIAVPVGAANGQKVLAAMNATKPDGNTPTAATLDVVIQKGMLNDATRDNYVVLVTDGMPNCGDVDVTKRVKALRASMPPVKTFVIGVGSAFFGNAALLNDWAVAGDTAKAGNPKYYQANSPKDLKAAFDAIAGGVASCTFKMGMKAPDPMQLYVWSNGKMVPADPKDGYTYDDATPAVILHGAACDQLRMNPMTKIQVVYGCPKPPPIS